MNKHLKKFHSKYKTLIEKLTQPIIITERLKQNLTIRAVFLGAILGTFGVYQITKNSPENYDKQNIEQLSEEDRGYFKIFEKQLRIRDLYETNQQGQSVESKELLEKSINEPEAKNFARELAEGRRMYNSMDEYQTLESRIELAKDVMYAARSIIQKKEYGGLGNYSLNYEYSEERDKMREGLRQEILKSDEPRESKAQLLKSVETMEIEDRDADSRQTFDEFYGPKDGKQFAGDCDDFSTALTTIYHAVRDYAEQHKEEDKYFEALAEGLKHYRIVGARMQKHALNLGLTVHDNGYSEIEVIEPQQIITRAEPFVVNDRVLIKYYNEKGEEVRDLIWRMYDRNFSAYAK